MSDPDRLHRECQSERLHAMGPRATGELQRELAARTGGEAILAELLDRYAALPLEVLRAVGGDRYHRPAPRLTPPEVMRRTA